MPLGQDPFLRERQNTVVEMESATDGLNPHTAGDI